MAGSGHVRIFLSFKHSNESFKQKLNCGLYFKDISIFSIKILMETVNDST